MIVRPIEKCDLNDIKEIHERHYKEEFSLPDFEKNFLFTFVVTDDNNKIICASGVKTILESVLITDLSAPIRIRKEALFDVLQGSLYLSDQAGYKELHAYVQGDSWTRILNKFGFQPTKGQSLIAIW